MILYDTRVRCPPTRQNFFISQCCVCAESIVSLISNMDVFVFAIPTEALRCTPYTYLIEAYTCANTLPDKHSKIYIPFLQNPIRPILSHPHPPHSHHYSHPHTTHSSSSSTRASNPKRTRISRMLCTRFCPHLNNPNVYMGTSDLFFLSTGPEPKRKLKVDIASPSLSH